MLVNLTQLLTFAVNFSYRFDPFSFHHSSYISVNIDDPLRQQLGYDWHRQKYIDFQNYQLPQVYQGYKTDTLIVKKPWKCSESAGIPNILPEQIGHGESCNDCSSLAL